MKISVGIMTSIKLRDRFSSCKNTWSSDFENVYFFGGNLSKNTELIPINEAGEDWDSAFLKQQLGLKYMFENNPNCEWYSLVGCDTVLFKENITNELKKYDHNKDYILCETYNRRMKINNFDFEVFAGGAGFFLSQSLMKKIHKSIISFNNEWLEFYKNGSIKPKIYGCGDVAISYFLQKYFNVGLTHLIGLYSQPPSFYEKNIEKPLSFHYIKPNEMMSIYKKYK